MGHFVPADPDGAAERDLVVEVDELLLDPVQVALEVLQPLDRSFDGALGLFASFLECFVEAFSRFLQSRARFLLGFLGLLSALGLAERQAGAAQPADQHQRAGSRPADPPPAARSRSEPVEKIDRGQTDQRRSGHPRGDLGGAQNQVESLTDPHRSVQEREALGEDADSPGQDPDRTEEPRFQGAQHGQPGGRDKQRRAAEQEHRRRGHCAD